MASAMSTRLSREEFRKAKELEELRKTGAAPPALDDEGKIINPHIPQYISSTPWYFNSQRPGLHHQYHSKFQSSNPNTVQSIHDSAKVTVVKERVTEYQPGACPNCGSLTHRVKDCLERPRARGAKHGGSVTGVNEVIKEKNMDFDAKRDRWAGFDVSAYSKVVERHEKEEMARKKKKLMELEQELKQEEKKHTGSDSGIDLSEKKETDASAATEPSTTESEVDKLRRLKRERRIAKVRQRLQSSTSSTNTDNSVDINIDSDSDFDSSDDDLADYGEVITKMDTKSRTTVRNLRIREDTAKYLYNLDPKSAHYDPKTRSMRQNPFPNKRPDEVLFAGDNFIRQSGDVAKIQQLQRYVWDHNEKLLSDANANNDSDAPNVHATALPSAAERLFELHQSKAQTVKQHSKQSILTKYGGEQHLLTANIPSSELLNVSETFVEFDSSGNVIGGDNGSDQKVIVRSTYEEDVFDGNHSSVWGSYYDRDSHHWGYQCCHQTLWHCICIGAKGRTLRQSISQSLKRKREDDSV